MLLLVHEAGAASNGMEAAASEPSTGGGARGGEWVPNPYRGIRKSARPTSKSNYKILIHTRRF